MSGKESSSADVLESPFGSLKYNNADTRRKSLDEWNKYLKKPNVKQREKKKSDDYYMDEDDEQEADEIQNDDENEYSPEYNSNEMNAEERERQDDLNSVRKSHRLVALQRQQLEEKDRIIQKRSAISKEEIEIAKQKHHRPLLHSPPRVSKKMRITKSNVKKFVDKQNKGKIAVDSTFVTEYNKGLAHDKTIKLDPATLDVARETAIAFAAIAEKSKQAANRQEKHEESSDSNDNDSGDDDINDSEESNASEDSEDVDEVDSEYDEEESSKMDTSKQSSITTSTNKSSNKIESTVLARLALREKVKKGELSEDVLVDMVKSPSFPSFGTSRESSTGPQLVTTTRSESVEADDLNSRFMTQQLQMTSTSKASKLRLSLTSNSNHSALTNNTQINNIPHSNAKNVNLTPVNKFKKINVLDFKRLRNSRENVMEGTDSHDDDAVMISDSIDENLPKKNVGNSKKSTPLNKNRKTPELIHIETDDEEVEKVSKEFAKQQQKERSYLKSYQGNMGQIIDLDDEQETGAPESDDEDVADEDEESRNRDIINRITSQENGDDQEEEQAIVRPNTKFDIPAAKSHARIVNTSNDTSGYYEDDEMGYEKEQDADIDDDAEDGDEEDNELEDDEEEEDYPDYSRVPDSIKIEMASLLQSFKGLSTKYRLVDKIGEGTFSSVYKAQDLLDISGKNCGITTWNSPPVKRQKTNEKKHENNSSNMKKRATYPVVALKRIYVTSSPQRIYNELHLLHSLVGCQNVAPLIDAIRHEDQVIAVLPFYKHSDFRDFYRDLPLTGIRTYMFELLTALSFVHSKNIIHRDIKPTNFLYNPFTKKGVLVDFGLAEREGYTNLPSCPCHQGGFSNSELPPANLITVKGYLKDDQRPARRANRAGTRGFRAPEVLFKCPNQTVKLDIWSVGVLLLTLLSRRFPFFNSQDDIDAIVELITIFGYKKVKQCAMLHGLGLECNIPKLEGYSLEHVIHTCLLLDAREGDTVSDDSPIWEYLSYINKKGKSKCAPGHKDTLKDMLISEEYISCLKLLHGLLELNYLDRLTASDALKFDFFNPVLINEKCKSKLTEKSNVSSGIVADDGEETREARDNYGKRRIGEEEEDDNEDDDDGGDAPDEEGEEEENDNGERMDQLEEYDEVLLD